jgi:hypothetical protein
MIRRSVKIPDSERQRDIHEWLQSSPALGLVGAAVHDHYSVAHAVIRGILYRRYIYNAKNGANMDEKA